ncbi:MAG: VWA domain-containing protein [Bdellovibrionales bacterium]|nr:VWA domain-containing protein [Bdellovibrionales bacterium]
MKNLMIRLPLSAALVLVLANCKSESPALTGPGPKPTPASYATPRPDAKNFSKAFAFETAEATATQERYDENQVSVLFQVTKDGQSVNGLTERNLRVTENGIPVTPFKIFADTQKLDQVADIAFVVDVTGSMGPFIESAKQVLTQFIRTTKNKGYHVRMCLSTFGDLVTQKCDRFYDNTSESQVSEFVTRLTGLQVSKGNAEVKPYIDKEENSMRALYEATGSPWEAGSQRFVILVTDADFYSPDKPGRFLEGHQSNPETVAPSMKQVNEVIAGSQVRVFAVTPSAAGYNSPLAGQKGVVQSSRGEHFDFFKVNKRQISLNSILDRILHSINTTYKLMYTVDKVTGLDPTLAVGARKISVTTDAGTVTGKGITSSMPNGRPNYKKEFTISSSPVQPDSVQVFIDGAAVNPSDFSATGGVVIFKNVPKAGSSLRFVYLYEAIDKNLRVEPIMIPGHTDARTTKVWLNGREAKAEDLTFGRDMSGNTTLSIAPSAMASNDPYDIRRNNGVKMQVVTNL